MYPTDQQFCSKDKAIKACQAIANTHGYALAKL
jgi:hypothetical protein